MGYVLLVELPCLASVGKEAHHRDLVQVEGAGGMYPLGEGRRRGEIVREGGGDGEVGSEKDVK